MHKFLIFIIIVSLLSGCTNRERQSKLQDDDKDMVGDFSSDQLVGTCWLLKTNAKNTKTWMRFYRSTIFYDEIIDSEIIEERSGNRISKSCYKTDYYISDHMPTKFDKSKVGKRTSGRYLVKERQAGGIRCLEIYMLTPTHLYLVENRDTTVCTRVDPYPTLSTSDDLKGDTWQEQDLLSMTIAAKPVCQLPPIILRTLYLHFSISPKSGRKSKADISLWTEMARWMFLWSTLLIGRILSSETVPYVNISARNQTGVCQWRKDQLWFISNYV